MRPTTNVAAVLTPKQNVVRLEPSHSVEEALALMDEHRYTAVPLVANAGNYLGTVTEGDLLRHLTKCIREQRSAEAERIADLPRRWPYRAVNIRATIDELLDRIMDQNFVPVVDDRGVFIGIVRRKSVLEHLLLGGPDRTQRRARSAYLDGSVVSER